MASDYLKLRGLVNPGPIEYHDPLVNVYYNPVGFDDLPVRSGLVGWFKSEEGTYQDTLMTTPADTATDPIAAWEDQSDEENHLRKTQGADWVLLADGIDLQTGFEFEFDNHFNPTETEVFIVANIAGDLSLLRGSLPGGSIYVSGADFQSFPLRADTSNDSADVSSVTYTPGTKVLFNVSLTDGLNSAQVNDNGADDTVVPTGELFQFEFFGYPTYDATGSILWEMVIYDRKLTVQERADVSSYLNSKYNI
jgi:hypothetical protein